ncbi:hypothetical protein [Kitasatospora sp. NPDC051914]|uniref:hypothetical protein n=1 Tax=Kitasatospora sp. NPDC051914 TaxID=3154945 RepID=UPI00342C3E46
MFLVWTLTALQAATLLVAAVRLTRRHREDFDRFPQTLRRTWPLLLATGLLPLAALLPARAPTGAWGVWGVLTIASALTYALADAYRDIPPAPARAGGAAGPGRSP